MTTIEELIQARITKRSTNIGGVGQVEFLHPNGKVSRVRPAQPFELKLWDALVVQLSISEQIPGLREDLELAQSQVGALRTNLERMRVDLAAAREVIEADPNRRIKPL